MEMIIKISLYAPRLLVYMNIHEAHLEWKFDESQTCDMRHSGTLETPHSLALSLYVGKECLSLKYSSHEDVFSRARL
jgi:hypothetical protein